MCEYEEFEEGEEAWIAHERTKVSDYLHREVVDHLGVGEFPAFHVFPYLAVWAVQSKKSPGWVGWWAISGDCPTDYISSEDVNHPRTALCVFSCNWAEASKYMLQGKEHPSIKIGPPEKWSELGDLLKRRSETLKQWADDEELWEDY